MQPFRPPRVFAASNLDWRGPAPMLLKISAAAAALVAATALGQSNYAGEDKANPTGAVQTDTSNGAAASAAVADSTTSSAGYNVGTPQTDPNTGAQIVTNG